MTLLYGWVRSLIVIVILGYLLELLVPSGSMRKYVRLVIGLVVTLTMLQPLLTVLRSGGQLFGLQTHVAISPQRLLLQGEYLRKKEEIHVMQAYETALMHTITQMLTRDAHVAKAKVRVHVGMQPQTPSFGQIQEVDITLYPSVTVIHVTKVRIASGEKKTKTALPAWAKKERNKIATLLAVAPTKVHMQLK